MWDNQDALFFLQSLGRGLARTTTKLSLSKIELVYYVIVSSCQISLTIYNCGVMMLFRGSIQEARMFVYCCIVLD